ncbi:MAG TPA: amidase family protein, partial [Roseiarcus sp.]
SVADLALSYDAMQGADPDDHAQAARPVELVTPSLDAGIADLRIARLGGYFARGGEAAAFAAVDRVARALAADRTVEFPESDRARAAAYLITMVEGASLHADRLRERAADYDPDVRDRLIAGAMLPGAWAVKAQKLRRWYRERVLEIFRDVDVVLAPATPTRAPRIGQRTFVLDGQEMLVRPNMGLFTQPISFIGLPVCAVPVWTDGERLPIGVQVIAPPWREDLALRVARTLEREGVVKAPIGGAA